MSVGLPPEGMKSRINKKQIDNYADLIGVIPYGYSPSDAYGPSGEFDPDFKAKDIDDLRIRVCEYCRRRQYLNPKLECAGCGASL